MITVTSRLFRRDILSEKQVRHTFYNETGMAYLVQCFTKIYYLHLFFYGIVWLPSVGVSLVKKYAINFDRFPKYS